MADHSTTQWTVNAVLLGGCCGSHDGTGVRGAGRTQRNAPAANRLNTVKIDTAQPTESRRVYAIE